MPTWSEDIREIFHDDIKDKKRISHGYAGKTAGHKGKTRTPIDIMSAKDKRQYQKGSKMITYNRKELMPYEQFRALTEKDQRELLEEWRNVHKHRSTTIQRFWGLTNGAYYRVLQKLNPVINGNQRRGSDISVEKRRNMTPEQREEMHRKRIETMRKNKALKQEKIAAEKRKKEALDKQEPIITEVIQPQEQLIEAYNEWAADVPDTLDAAQLNSLQLDLSGDGSLVLDRLIKLIGFIGTETGKYRLKVELQELGNQ